MSTKFDVRISLHVCSMLVEWNVIPYFGVIIDTGFPGCVGGWVSGRSQSNSLKLHPGKRVLCRLSESCDPCQGISLFPRVKLDEASSDLGLGERQLDPGSDAMTRSFALDPVGTHCGKTGCREEEGGVAPDLLHNKTCSVRSRLCDYCGKSNREQTTNLS